MEIKINWRAVAIVAGLMTMGAAGYFGIIAPEQGARAIDMLLGFFGSQVETPQ
jgi:hypothetical protein